MDQPHFLGRIEIERLRAAGASVVAVLAITAWPFPTLADLSVLGDAVGCSTAMYLFDDGPAGRPPDVAACRIGPH